MTKKPMSTGQLNKKLHWCTVSIRRSTLAQLKALAEQQKTSVADLIDKLAHNDEPKRS